MPLINGQKMACEPCIRGHRSTKCTHANERLMVPVRKPGRPLSSCPHASSKPCSCGAVTAAIPRKQKCSCGPSEKPAATKPDLEESSSETPPSGDSKASNSHFRVQKATSRRASTRKPSIDPAGLERMDSSQMNIMPTYDGAQTPVGMTSAPMNALGGMHPYSVMGMSPTESPFAPHPMMLPMFPQPMPSPMMHPGTSKPTTNGHTSPMTNGSATAAAPTHGGCCGGNSNEDNSKESSPTRETSAAASDANDPPGKAKSCCTSKTTDSDKSTSEATTRPQVPQQANGMMMPPFQAPIPMANGMYPFFAHPTFFTYPPQYGTYMQPLQPEQWRQVIAALSYGQPAPTNGFDMAGAGVGTVPYSPTQDSQPKGHGTSHHCDCGEGCQCVGCAAHPYNEATQSYVRSAWNSMIEQQTNSGHSYTNGTTSHDVSVTHSPNETTAVSTTPAETNGNGTAPRTPSDAASGMSEEQALSANDFFFVSYPFGDTCAGDTASCPCGDDCQCIGCVIHSNPDPSQPSQATDQQPN